MTRPVASDQLPDIDPREAIRAVRIWASAEESA
jgi:hypothetical protein